jgi:transposase
MTCQNCARLQEENRKLTQENTELRRRLAAYENPHTPPSRRAYPTRIHRAGARRYPGRPRGHPGVTRPRHRPDAVKAPSPRERCEGCGASLGEPSFVGHRVVEEIMNPSPRQVIDYLTYEYECPSCGGHSTARHPDCPPSGWLGKNALVQATLLRYQERLPVRKAAEALGRTYGLSVAPATVLDMTDRVAGWLRPEYEAILGRIRVSPVVYVDETGVNVDGVRHWIWVFTTRSETLFAVRRSRGKKVLREVLGGDYKGVVVCDGWRSYPNYTSRLQRCWAHLLREARYLAEHVEEAAALSEGLHRLYRRIGVPPGDRPPPDMAGELAEEARAEVLRLAGRPYSSGEVRRFAGKVVNGLDHWFTFLEVAGCEATNNRAERALRELVVQRKIMGCFRNGKGTLICETVMSVLSTWGQQGRDLSQALGDALTREWMKS